MKKIIFLSVALGALILGVILTACPTEPTEEGYAITIAQLTNGSIKSSAKRAKQNVSVTLTVTPNEDYQLAKDSLQVYSSLAAVEVQDTGGGVYTFFMPAANVTVTANFTGIEEMGASAFVYKGKFIDTGAKSGSSAESGEGAVSSGVEFESASEGFIPGTSAIKVNVASVSGYLELNIPLSSAIDLSKYDVLSLQVKGSATSAKISEIAFETTDGSRVTYTGNTNTGISLRTDWSQILAPVPKRVSKSVNKIIIRFAPSDVAGKTITIDRIGFIAVAEKTLSRIVVPSTGPAIPFKINGVVYVTDIGDLLSGVRFEYAIGTQTVSLYGSKTDFAGFYSDFAMELDDETDATISGSKLTPINPGTTVALLVKADGVSSGKMTITIMDSPKTIEDGKVEIDALRSAEVNHVTGGPQQVLEPYWVQADDGECQYGTDDGGRLNIYTSYDLLGTFALGNTGEKKDKFPGINCDLTGCSKVVVSMRLRTGLVYEFNLFSGYEGMPSTLNENGQRKQGTWRFTGEGGEPAAQAANGSNLTLIDYEFLLDDFEGDLDITSVTGYSFVTKAEWNDPAISSGSNRGHAFISGIIAHE